MGNYAYHTSRKEKCSDEVYQIEVYQAWFDLISFWNDYLKDKPATARFSTCPQHLQGLGLALKYDTNSILPSGREEKEAGEEIREKAICVIAEARDNARKDDPKSKEHLKPRRLHAKEQNDSGGFSSDAFLQTYITLENERNRQETRAAKVNELNTYVAMLGNSHLPPESRVAVTALLTGVTQVLARMQAAAEVGLVAADGGGAVPACSTPEKASTGTSSAPSRASSSAPNEQLASGAFYAAARERLQAAAMAERRRRRPLSDKQRRRRM